MNYLKSTATYNGLFFRTTLKIKTIFTLKLLFNFTIAKKPLQLTLN